MCVLRNGEIDYVKWDYGEGSANSIQEKQIKQIKQVKESLV